MATTKRPRKTTTSTTRRAKTAPAKAAAKRKTNSPKSAAKTTKTPAAKRARKAPAAAPSAVPDPIAVTPTTRRAIFFDVENTSRAEDVVRVLEHLQVDFSGRVEFMAVGNWRVIGHEPARLLAAHGASLVHSAPSTGVRDWSDLRIAVAAGVWLASAAAGDVVDIVSDDQAFDAVGDVAASRGVVFRRLSYRSLAGIVKDASPSSGGSRSRRSRRGGRRKARRSETSAQGAGAPKSVATEPEGAAEGEVQTAPLEELREVVRELVVRSPAGVSLDALANALRERGFRRKPGSPRLITRLKQIKDIDVTSGGKILLADAGSPPASSSDESGATSASEATTNGTGRRRRRRGGRRRRGRRSGSGAAVEAAASV